MSSLLDLPVFGPEHAACDSCELQKQLVRNQIACAYRPKKFNGLMIVGEGPGQQEVVEGRPFVGPAGRLLRSILESVNLDLDECFITNATLCKPPPKQKALQDEFPHAIPSCLGRLEAEIAAVRPKVIVALGAAAWIAVSGYDKHKIRHTPADCEHCKNARKVGPVLQCNAPVPVGDGSTSGPCGHLHFLNAKSKLDVDAAELEALRASGCSKCGARLKRSTPKMVKCPVCHGRKRRIEEYDEFTWDLNISAAAGAIFEPAPEGAQTRKTHEVSPWYAEQGVAYVVPTYHPAHILRGQQFLAKSLQKHFAKAKRLLDGGRPIEIKYQVTRDPELVRDFVNGRLPDTAHFGWHLNRKFAPNFACDIETASTLEGGDAREIYEVTDIHCIGIGTIDEAIVVDTRDVNPADPNDPLIQAIADVLLDPDIPKSYHHGAGYDVFVLDKIWGIPWEEQIESYTDDSMFAHINLYPDEPHDLGHVAFECVDARAWKPPRTHKGSQVFSSFEELAFYNARDTIHTARARENLGVDRGKAIPGARMWRAKLSDIYEMDCKLRKLSIGMSMHGMPLDKERFADVGRVAKENVADAEHEIHEALIEAGFGGSDHQEHARAEADAAGEPSPCQCRACTFNPNSGPQLQVLLFGPDSYFNLPVLSTTDKGAASTDKVTLTKLLATARNEHALRFLQGKIALLKHSFIDKNYVSSPKMQPWADGRIHPIWKQWGARTGRFSSSPNAQNWPLWLRATVVAPKGRLIVGGDQSQLELRGMAWLTGDKELVRRCIEADESRKLEPECDPHSYVASLAFGARYSALHLKDPEHDKANPRCVCQTCKRKLLRDITKRVIYGLNYGAGEETVLQAIYDGGYEGPPITIDMIAHVKLTVFRAFPDIPRWRDAQVTLAQKEGELRSPIFGRRRIFPLNEVPVTECYNFPIQSVGGDIMNEGMLIFAERLPDVDPTAFIIAQVHDAIYSECNEDRADAVARLLEDCLTVEYTRNGITMPFIVSAHSAQDWKAAA